MQLDEYHWTNPNSKMSNTLESRPVALLSGRGESRFEIKLKNYFIETALYIEALSATSTVEVDAATLKEHTHFLDVSHTGSQIGGHTSRHTGRHTLSVWLRERDTFLLANRRCSGRPGRNLSSLFDRSSVIRILLESCLWTHTLFRPTLWCDFLTAVWAHQRDRNKSNMAKLFKMYWQYILTIMFNLYTVCITHTALIGWWVRLP